MHHDFFRIIFSGCFWLLVFGCGVEFVFRLGVPLGADLLCEFVAVLGSRGGFGDAFCIAKYNTKRFLLKIVFGLAWMGSFLRKWPQDGPLGGV